MQADEPPSGGPGPRVPPIALLVALSAINTIALNMFVPSMPGMVDVFGTSPAAVQLTLSFYLAAFAVAQLAIGPLSDRYGRRPVLLWGLAIYALAPLLCAAAWSIGSLAGARALQAIGGCAGIVLARAVIRDLHERDRAASVIGLVTMLTALATAAAPAMGGLLDLWLGWRASFLAVALSGAVVFAWTFARLPETNPVATGQSMLRTFRGCGQLLRSPAFIGYSLHGACTLAAWYSMIAGLPYLLVDVLGRPATDYGLYFPLLSFGYMAGNFITSRVAQRLGVHRLMLRGAWLAVASCVVLYLWYFASGPAALAIVLPMAVVVLSHGVSQPSAIAGAVSVNPALAGSAAGVMGFGQGLVAAGGAQLVGMLQNGTVHPLFAVVTTFAVVSLLACFLARWGEAREAPPAPDAADRGAAPSLRR
jgi:DHA1 family bicyclomycin/chloramphenicol resistance-like MFS transporter